ncbi:MAG: class I SAM-dependent methyltransferase [Pseudolabrys sp.]
MEHLLSCPICGEAASWPIPHHRNPEVDAWRAEVGDSTDYAWRLCRRCGNGYPTVQPDLRVLSRIWEAARMEEETNPARAAALWQQRRNVAQAYAERSYRLLAPLASIKPGRFLDVACGLGETVRRFAIAGWDAEGIDADPTTLAFHREIGIRSRIGQIENLDITGNYELIHIANAIYFITNPTQLLRRLRSYLAPNGLFCVVLSDFMAAHDPSLPSYGHSFFPTARSMQYALAIAGFETILKRTRPGTIYIVARAGNPAPPTINTDLINWRYRTKRMRYALIGRPYLAMRHFAKKLLKR